MLYSRQTVAIFSKRIKISYKGDSQLIILKIFWKSIRISCRVHVCINVGRDCGINWIEMAENAGTLLCGECN